ncbi:MAG: aldo/keto reductase [Chloroflexota bacterium]|nr:aldo/keto reductase [Chloroflexota bacterium]
MDYRYLGRTGMKVSTLCLGAMTFGRETEEALSYEMMDRFAAAGGNFIDTANVYSRGLSEKIVGCWLKQQRREDFVVAKEVGRTPAQVALNWVANRPDITAPIIGVRKLVHLKDNLGAAKFTLTEVSQPELPYPYDIVARSEAQRGRG